MSTSAAQVVFGAGSLGREGGFDTPEAATEVCRSLQKYGVKKIDTAQLYPNSHEVLGAARAGDEFVIDTKWKCGGDPGSATKENLPVTAKASLETLGIKKADIFYLHVPDPSVPIESTLAGVDAAHKAGYFARFGLSNYTPQQVEEIHAHCKAHDYVLPTVYQGHYNAISRKPETALLPILRKLGMSYYAYSPLCGGFLTKTKQQILEGTRRFGGGKIYDSFYCKPEYLDAIAKWEEAAAAAGVGKAELGYRWVAYHSALKGEYEDALILGASSTGQVEQTLEYIAKGPLPEQAVQKVVDVWKTVEPVASLDIFNA